MLQIDKAILDIDKVICKNIAKFDASERGLLSQNILAQLRNLVEYIAQKVYSDERNGDPNDYTQKKNALEYIRTRGELKFLAKFHMLLQKSASHYTVDENGSERLMLKYYEYLLKIKLFLKNNYGLEVLSNIDEFPLDLDNQLIEYYEKIVECIESPGRYMKRNAYDERSYIQKIKPIFVRGKIYYEVTFTLASDKVSKFDRVIAFTDMEISDNYAVKLSIRDDFINVMGQIMPVQIIDKWEVAIRPCEVNRFASILGEDLSIGTGNIEYRNLMSYLTESKMSLFELVKSSEGYYNHVKVTLTQFARVTPIFNLLDRCRVIVNGGMPGENVIRYFLHKMNNRVMKMQYSGTSCEKLSGTCVEYGCIPFDEMPFATSLIRHNPRVSDLFECIESEGREHEFLGRIIKNNTEYKGMLFTHKDELVGFENVDELCEKYNSLIYYKHTGRYIRKYKEYYYIKEYVDDSTKIINILKAFSNAGIEGYSDFVESWLQKGTHIIDSEEKANILRTLFCESKVVLIYGSAGTGKSTLINHISNLYGDRRKLYLANTNPAVNNMRRKVTAGNSEFKTIKKFLGKSYSRASYDILFIDECSTVSNKDMREILEKATFRALVLVGDVYQIESITFGNWFSIARDFIPEKSIFELTKPYRSTNDDLLLVWDRVRKLDDAILEPIVKNNYSETLNQTVFEKFDEDEIVLCLNYDGLYGINNVNRFLQCNNSNAAIEWGINIYKIGDPILFNESERFTPLIYNNMKGKILGIEVLDAKIQFDVEIDSAITEWEAEDYDFTLLGNSEEGKSIIRFTVNKYKDTGEDDDSSDTIVPFQVAYAVSIHKAQGLEYKSVKLVITNEVGERITHNIFYTAITRAKEKLKIYWSPETEKGVLESLELRDYHRDAELLRGLSEL